MFPCWFRLCTEGARVCLFPFCGLWLAISLGSLFLILFSTNKTVSPKDYMKCFWSGRDKARNGFQVWISSPVSVAALCSVLFCLQKAMADTTDGRKFGAEGANLHTIGKRIGAHCKDRDGAIGAANRSQSFSHTWGLKESGDGGKFTWRDCRQEDSVEEVHALSNSIKTIQTTWIQEKRKKKKKKKKTKECCCRSIHTQLLQSLFLRDREF